MWPYNAQIMLNILEDYLIASDIDYGRIDGSIQGNLRQKVHTAFELLCLS